MNRINYKKYNIISEYSIKGTYYRKGIFSKNINWYEQIHKDNFSISSINLENNVMSKKVVRNINDWLTYCNKNNINEVNIYINKPNIKILSNNLQNILNCDEEFNIRNISINYVDDYINFHKKTVENNLIKNDNIKGTRNLRISSFNVNNNNYNQTNIQKIINFNNNLFINYNIPNIIFDNLSNIKFNRYYNFEINDNIINIEKKILEIQKNLESFYKNDYYKFIDYYTIFFHIKTKSNSNNLINQIEAINNLKKIKDNIMLEFNVIENNKLIL